MLFAAGLGTRLKPLTDNKPKALAEMGGKTFLQHTIEKLKSSGVTEIVVNVHHFSGQIISFLENNDFGVTIHISDESGELLDTGGGLKKAARFFTGKEPVLVYNVDVFSDIILDDVVKFHQKGKALATLVVRQRKTSRYLLFNKAKRLIGWENLGTGEKIISVPEETGIAIPYAFSGIHVLNPKIFSLIKNEGKFPILPVYLELARQYKILGYIDESDVWMDLGKPEQLHLAEVLFSK